MKLIAITRHPLIKALLILLGAGGMMLVGAIGYQLMSSAPTSSMPLTVRDELTFSPLVIPNDSERFTASSYKFATVEDGTKLLTFIISGQDVTVTVTEYVQPPEFSEIPEYKTQFLSNVIKQNATVQTANGTMYLGRGVKENDRQLAVMLERGLVIFLTPQDASRELSEATWRELGETLEIEKIRN